MSYHKFVTLVREQIALYDGMRNTSFRRWRDKLDLTQEQAARVLGVTLRTVQHWEAGRELGYPVRLAMAAVAENLKLEPWPE